MSGRSQWTYIGCAIRAFVRPEYHRFAAGISRFAAKWAVVRDAVGKPLEQPHHCLPEPAAA